MHAKESDGAGGDVSAPIEVATFDLGEPLMQPGSQEVESQVPPPHLHRRLLFQAQAPPNQAEPRLRGSSGS